MPMKTRDITAANRAAWNASAPAFEAGDDWQTMLAAAAKPGFSELDATLTDALRGLGIDGTRALQIGCNNGRELLSLASLGAVPALGIDVSDAFIEQATQLASAAGSDCHFVRADIYDLPADLPTGFDLGLITIGVLNWMPDLPRFFQVVSDLLTPGAALVIYETHPFLEVFDPEAQNPFLPATSYFRKDPFVETETFTYDGSDRTEAPASYWFVHTLGDIVTACAAAGLRIDRLTEYPHSNREVDYDVYRDQDAQLPMCYLLVARKPG